LLKDACDLFGATDKEKTMLRWSLLCFIVSLVAAFVGFGGMSQPLSGVGKVLFFLFVGGLIVTLALDFAASRPKRLGGAK